MFRVSSRSPFSFFFCVRVSTLSSLFPDLSDLVSSPYLSHSTQSIQNGELQRIRREWTMTLAVPKEWTGNHGAVVMDKIVGMFGAGLVGKGLEALEEAQRRSACALLVSIIVLVPSIYESRKVMVAMPLGDFGTCKEKLQRFDVWLPPPRSMQLRLLSIIEVLLKKKIITVHNFAQLDSLMVALGDPQLYYAIGYQILSSDAFDSNFWSVMTKLCSRKLKIAEALYCLRRYVNSDPLVPKSFAVGGEVMNSLLKLNLVNEAKEIMNSMTIMNIKPTSDDTVVLAHLALKLNDFANLEIFYQFGLQNRDNTNFSLGVLYFCC